MEEKKENEIRGKAESKAKAWAEKRLIVLEEAAEYDRSLSELTGSEYDLDRRKKLDHYGQAKLLEMMFQKTERRDDINELMGTEEAYGLLFAGPAGCGKMTTAEHLIGNLKKMGYARLAMLTGVKFGNHSKKKVVKRMEAVLNLATEEQPLILILEQLSENVYADELYDILLEFAEEQEPGVFFPILIERKVEMFSSALKRDYPLLVFSLPSLQERKNYIRLHQNVEILDEEEQEDSEEEQTEEENEVFSYKIVFDGITPEEIAEETEGFSFAQLRQLMEYVKLYMADIVVRDPVSDEYAYERLQDEGHYTVRGHLVRQAIAMLNHAEKHSTPVADPEAFLSRPDLLPQFLVRSDMSPQTQESPAWQAPVQADNVTFSGIEKKVKNAAEGGKKDILALSKRYEAPVFQKGEFGKVNELLADAPDEYDEEE